MNTDSVAQTSGHGQTPRHISERPGTVGIFDSGIGGLSVWREIHKELPAQPLLYLADRGNHPYGSKPLLEVRELAERITRFLLAHGAQIIVVACNTASAAALYHLRAVFPEVPIIGMEPALKPAAEHTRSGRIGVLATAGTLSGEPYAGVMERFARGVKVFEQACPGLAEMIEHNRPTAEIRQKLEEWLRPMRDAEVDQLALACTHYPLILNLISEVAGAGIQVIDPSPAIARQVRRKLAECEKLQSAALPPAMCHSDRGGELTFWTTGNTTSLQEAVLLHTGLSAPICSAVL